MHSEQVASVRAGVQAGFRRRGHQVTRTETFVDAAFAFSLTLLVIFHNDLPQTVAELRAALLRVPTFVLCFAMLALFGPRTTAGAGASGWTMRSRPCSAWPSCW